MTSELHLYDTAARAVDRFVPITPGKVGIYLCGATVQAPPHIGHIRSGVNFDILRRWLTATGYEVTFIRNVTDIDDKILHKAVHEKTPWWAVAMKYERAFTSAYSSLNVLPPTYEPRATGHITQMVSLMETLIANGSAYAPGNGDVYLEVRKLKRYLTLSNQKLDDLQPAEDADMTYKKDPRDFALWKAAKPGDPSWPTPWGAGRPGWHLECSAMAFAYLGESFDIHGGGLDLIFPHHENEIAQSEAATGKAFVRHWFHVSHLLVENRKMSKSLGNLYTLDDVTSRGWDSSDLRLVLLSGHYRQPLNFSWDTMTAVRHGRERLGRLRLGLEEASKGKKGEGWGSFQPAWNALREDLETPKTLGALYTAVGELEQKQKKGFSPDEAAKELSGLDRILKVLGVSPAFEQEVQAPAEMQKLAEARNAARQAKDWKESDRLRDELAKNGWEVRDAAGGWRLVRKPGTP